MDLTLIGVVLAWVVVAAFVALGSWIGFQLIYQNGRMLSRLESLEQRLAQMSMAPPLPPAAPAAQPPGPAPAPQAPAGLPAGTAAPDFDLPDLEGGRRSLSDFRGRRLLVVFFNPRCGFCTRMASDLAALPIDGAGGQPLPLVLSTGDAEENRKLVQEHGTRCPVLLQQGMEVASRYQCNGTPMGYLIDERGRIASEQAIGSEALLALAEDRTGRRSEGATGRPNAKSRPLAPSPPRSVVPSGPLGGKRTLEESKLQRNGLAPGTPAPGFRLPLLHGGELALAEYRDRRVLLVFSDPNCGPCDQLAPQLEQHARRSPGVQILMVSRGDHDANRAKAAEHALTFPIVLQRQWEVSRDYAMFATPVAYLIDEDGIIAAEVAVGVDPILALLSTPAPSANGKRAAHATRAHAGRHR